MPIDGLFWPIKSPSRARWVRDGRMSRADDGGRWRGWGAEDQEPFATHLRAYTILVDLLSLSQMGTCPSTAGAAPRANSRPGSISTGPGSCRRPHLGRGPCFNGEPSGGARPPAATPARWPLWRASAAQSPPQPPEERGRCQMWPAVTGAPLPCDNRTADRLPCGGTSTARQSTTDTGSASLPGDDRLATRRADAAPAVPNAGALRAWCPETPG